MRASENQLRILIREILQEKKRPKPEKNIWDNIRAKQARGEEPSEPGEEGYPDEKTWRSATNEISESLAYHTKNGVGVDKNIFRPGSTEFFRLFREARSLYYAGRYTISGEEERELLEDLDIGEFALYDGRLVPLDYPIQEGNEEHLFEAEYKGRKVDLNKPKRGGSKGAYVYVDSGKRDKDGKVKVKKVEFGSSMPDAMGDSEKHKDRRKNFGDRHNCAEKDDKTAPGYWSCRLTKFFGRDIPGWW